MAPEPSRRSRRHRSQSRPRPREHSPLREPSHRRPPRDASPLYSPTRKRSDPEPRSHRHKPVMHQRAKSRPPQSKPGMNEVRVSVKRPRVRFSMVDVEGAAKAISAKATYSGFLRKQADNEPGAWNKYYFVIKPLTYLLYYNTKDDDKPRGIIDLEYLTDVKRNVDCLQRAIGGSDNCFRVSGKLPRPTAEQVAMGEVPKMRPLYLDPESAEDAEEWINAIRNHRFSVKRDKEFFAIAQQMRDAEIRVSRLEEIKVKEAEDQRNLRAKAKKLLQQMRAVQSGNMDELPEVTVDDLDDTADTMLALLEGMEDALVGLQGKLSQQKLNSVEPTNIRKGFAQVMQRAVSRRENTHFVELDEKEETLAAIRSRRQRNQEMPKEKAGTVAEVPRERVKEKSKELPIAKAKVEKNTKETKKEPKVKSQDEVKIEKKKESKEMVQEDVPELENVSDVLAMWKAKKKKNPSSGKPTNSEDNTSRKRTKSRSKLDKLMSAPKYQSGDQLSEEDTLSVVSSDESDCSEKLPPGWTKHESRGYPGTYYYAHESGKVSWEVPTEEMIDGTDCISDREDQSELEDGDVYSEYEVEEEVDIYPDTTRTIDTSPEYSSECETDPETAGATTSAAYRRKKPKPKSAWAFKLPKLLPTNPTPAAPTEAAAISSSPIRHGANHHEF
ncbi:WW domain [Plasmopara halstedii]|uniref:WW domain n=1 Tax=Plasmopara halstedii TaxID=4781 RepID=A0A0P1AG69_PLAHL|nr:WW domain [Plasmopara halstedii]CEG40113.1 WW domain [Plasmopara halstedii]|eukprot:XP_024576482.1 WW domain [Plasmopara halstedii]